MKSLTDSINEAMSSTKLKNLESEALDSLSTWLMLCENEQDLLAVILDIGEILGGFVYSNKKYPDTKEQKELAWDIDDFVVKEYKQILKSLGSYDYIKTNDFTPNTTHSLSNVTNDSYLRQLKRNVEVWILNCSTNELMYPALYNILNEMVKGGKKILKRGHPALKTLTDIANKLKNH